MKNFGVITLLAVLVSCGGNGGSKANEGATLDPLTQDKFEESIRSLRPGMVTTKTTVGTELRFDSDMAGKLTVTTRRADAVTKETILNITGDDIYTLTETDYEDADQPTDREVTKESLEGMIADYNDPLPKGFSVSVVKNMLSVTGSVSSDFEIDATTKLFGVYGVNMSLNLDDIRCSQRSKTTATGRMVQNGKATKLPVTGTTDVGGCGPTLSAAELRAVDLSSVTLCDETTGDEENRTCNGGMDLSHLVQ